MHIREAVRADLPDIASLAGKAFLGEALSSWFSPEHRENPQRFRERCLYTNTRRFNAGLFMLLMVTDEDGPDWDGKSKVIGYAAYEKKVGASDDTSKRKTGLFWAFERWAGRRQQDYYYYFRNNLGAIRSRWNNIDKVLSGPTPFDQFDRFWELELLAVDNDYGRRGIGTKFLAWGQERAQADGVPLLLWSTVMGKPLYTRVGFEVIGELHFGDDEYIAPCMKWEPKPGNATAEHLS